MYILESVYAKDQYPDKLVREEIAARLGITETKVYVSIDNKLKYAKLIFSFVFHQNWFQNRRVKEKRLNARAPVIPNSNTIITSASSASKINECADVPISVQRNQSNHPLDRYHVTKLLWIESWWLLCRQQNK